MMIFLRHQLDYRYSDGTKIAYESLISNKFNGMEDQILGHKGTMEMAKGIYYLEEDHSTSGIRQLIGQVKDKVFAAIPTAGPSWRPETKMEYTPHFVIEGDINVNNGLSMIGADKDGSDIILRATIKPTPSISATQHTVNKSGEEIDINIKGRHDPIIVPRAVVVVESMAAITIVDAMFANMSARMDSLERFYK